MSQPKSMGGLPVHNSFPTLKDMGGVINSLSPYLLHSDNSLYKDASNISENSVHGIS